MQTQQINRLEWQISVSTHSLSHTHRHGLKRIAKDKQPDNNNNNNSKDREKKLVWMRARRCHCSHGFR